MKAWNLCHAGGICTTPAASLLATLLYAGLTVFAFCQHWQHPMANWDALPYTALALRLDGLSDDRLRNAALAEVRTAFPERFDDFVGGGTDDGYRRTVAAEDTAFMAQLPFYTGKPLYVLGTFALGKLEGNFAAATAHLSALAFLLIGVLAAIARPRTVPTAAWLLALVLACSFGVFPLSLLASASSPDTLSAALFLGGVLLAGRQRIGLAALLLLLAQLARPDAIIPVLTFFLALAASDARHRLPLLLGAGLGIAVWQAVTVLTAGYPLEVLLSTLVARQPYPGDARLALGSPEYMQVLFRYLADLAGNPRFLVLGAIGAVSLLVCARNGFRWPGVLLLTALVNIVAHAVLFPEVGGYQERFFFVSYVLILMAAGMLIGEAESRRRAASACGP